MRGDQLPDGSNVTRLCSKTQLSEEGWPEATAFLLKTNEPYLSVNWLEGLGIEGRDEQIAEVLRVLKSKRDVRPSARLALINVGEARTAVRTGTPDNLEIWFAHDPEDNDESHSGAYNLPIADSSLMAAEQLTMAVLQSLPVV